MTPITIGPDRSFTLDGEKFVIDVTGNWDRRPSDDSAFTIVKNEPYLRFYEKMAETIHPKAILELGIFQGGSFVFLDKLFKPRTMAALDLSPTPIVPLAAYIARHEGRSAYYATSQTDRKALERIVSEDLKGEMDFVIDDASHAYEFTKTSFEILFPLLAPGGTYIIEDWAWAHHPAFQKPDAPFASQPALTNLLFEQIMAMACSTHIAEITVTGPLYVVKKSHDPLPPGKSLWASTLLRGKTFQKI